MMATLNHITFLALVLCLLTFTVAEKGGKTTIRRRLVYGVEDGPESNSPALRESNVYAGIDEEDWEDVNRLLELSMSMECNSGKSGEGKRCQEGSEKSKESEFIKKRIGCVRYRCCH
jgi:hypothetical protein